MSQFKFPSFLYCISSREYADQENIIAQIKAMALGGAKIIQYRDKNINPIIFEKNALEIKNILEKKNILFIINDYLEIANKIGVYQIHLGQEDLKKYGNTVKEAVKNIKKINPKFILGISTHSFKQAQAASLAGADYIGVGSIFPTKTKKNPEYIKMEEVEKIANQISIPKVGIGGVNFKNYQLLLKKGLDAVAMVREICVSSQTGNSYVQNLSQKITKIL